MFEIFRHGCFNADDTECLAEVAEEKVVFSAPLAKTSASSAVKLKRSRLMESLRDFSLTFCKPETKPYLCSGREPSPRPSPFMKGRGRTLASVWIGSLNSDRSIGAEEHSLSPSDGERAGVRGLVNCILTA